MIVYLPQDWLERFIEAIDKYDAVGAGGTYIETNPLLIDVRSQRKIGEFLLKEPQTDTTGLVGILVMSCTNFTGLIHVLSVLDTYFTNLSLLDQKTGSLYCTCAYVELS